MVNAGRRESHSGGIRKGKDVVYTKLPERDLLVVVVRARRYEPKPPL
jgi:hypothetical protein